MTVDKLKRLPWRLKWHCSGDICVSVYEARVGFHSIIRENHTERIDFCKYGKSVTRYRFNGKTYRSHKSVVEAINKIVINNKKK